MTNAGDTGVGHEPWSMRTPLEVRIACPECGHLHRAKIAVRCKCCKRDAEGES